MIERKMVSNFLERGPDKWLKKTGYMRWDFERSVAVGNLYSKLI